MLFFCTSHQTMLCLPTAFRIEIVTTTMLGANMLHWKADWFNEKHSRAQTDVSDLRTEELEKGLHIAHVSTTPHWEHVTSVLWESYDERWSAHASQRESKTTTASSSSTIQHCQAPAITAGTFHVKFKDWCEQEWNSLHLGVESLFRATPSTKSQERHIGCFDNPQ